MNQDEFEGKWKQLRGETRARSRSCAMDVRRTSGPGIGHVGRDSLGCGPRYTGGLRWREPLVPSRS